MGKLFDRVMADIGRTTYYRGGMQRYGLLRPPDPNEPAVLLYDIETAPGLCWMWGAFNQNVVAIEQDWYMLSFAYKWLGTDDMGFVSIIQDPDFYPDSSNDRFVAERLACLFDVADWTVAHNGDKFDRKMANTSFSRNKLDPPSPHQSIDTKKMANREMRHFKNNLNDLARVYGFGQKVQHYGFDLWRECMRGNELAWGLMEEYNRQDVRLLEELYITLRPWSGLPGKPAHPNIGFWRNGKLCCGKCGSEAVTPATTPHRATVSEWKVWRCVDCGSLSRARKRMSQAGGFGVKSL